MYTVVEAEAFAVWMEALRDKSTRGRLQIRLRKAGLGHLGDVRPVGDGVWEMREFFGPGCRMYYVMRGSTIVVMLGGGDKSSQQRDIERARKMAQELHL